MKYLTRLFFCAMSIFLISCQEINTTDPEEALDHWLGIDPSEEVTPVNAKYWQSAHFFKEYTIYIELKASDEWIDEFIKKNSLIKGSTGKFFTQDGGPSWFKTGSLIPYQGYRNPSIEDAYYFVIPEKNKMLIFESQM